MPFDDRVTLALSAVVRARSGYRSAVIAASERATGLLTAGGGSPRAALELGQFGTTRIDAARFAALGSAELALDDLTRSRIDAAARVLQRLSVAGDDAFVVNVPAGGRLRFAIASALGALGRAFGAAAAVELARSHRYDPAAHDEWLLALGFELWGRAERLVAPPVVVRVQGEDLRAGVLSDFLDGSMKIALVVEGPCAPAPLVRLIAPGTFVLQTSDATGVDLFAKCDGPAIMALVPETAASFVHNPAAGRSAWQRTRVWKRPTSLPRKSLGGISARQQLEELAQLDALVERPSLEGAPVESLVPSGAGDPTDRLASWLLDASGLKGQ